MVSSAARRHSPSNSHPGPRSRPEMSAGMNIGSVLSLLRPEFPDVSISKIRFLEEQGLVEPERTAAGYRKFSHADVDRLRYVLGVQRDHYLPLKVIREQLEALDSGREPSIPGAGPGPGSPRLVASYGESPATPTPSADQRLSRADLIDQAGIDESLLTQLESFGIVIPRAGGLFDGDALTVAQTAGELASFGIEPRHLRAFRTAADREAGLVEQVVRPMRSQRDAEAAARAEETTREVSGLCVRLHAALVKTALDRGSA